MVDNDMFSNFSPFQKRYLAGLRRSLCQADYRRACEAVANNSAVIIYENDETGKRLFAVALADTPDFWLHAFSTIRAAEMFVCKMGLSLTKPRNRN